MREGVLAIILPSRFFLVNIDQIKLFIVKTPLMAEELILSLKVDAEQGKETLDNTEDKLNKVQKETKETSDSFGLANTKAGKLFSGIVAGAKKGIGAMKTLRGAVIATGIAALALAVLSLTQYFTKTARGAEQFRKIMAGVGQVIATVTDTLITIGETLTKIGRIIGSVVKGNKTLSEGFQEAKQVGKDAVDTIADSYENLNGSVREAIALAERENVLRRDRMANTTEEARLQVQVSNARARAADVTLTEQERISALNEAAEAQNKLYDERIRLAREEFEIVAAQNALSESTLEDMEREAELEATLIRLEAERADRSREIVAQESALRERLANERDKEIQEEQKRVEKEAELQQQRLDKIREITNQITLLQLEGQEKELEALKQKHEERLREVEDDAEQRKLLEEQYRIEVLAINKRYDDQETERQKAQDQKEQEQIRTQQEELLLLQLEGRELELEELNLWYEQQAQAIAGNEQALTLLKEQYAIRQADINEKYNEAQVQQDRIAFEQRKAIQLEYADVIGEIGSFIQEIAGENKELAIAGLIIEQAASVAQIAINTTVAATKALAELGPIAGAIAATAIIAGGVVGTAKAITAAAQGINEIQNTNVKKQRGGFFVGATHSEGGIPLGNGFEVEDEEFLVNRRTMSNPQMRSEILRMNSMGNLGLANTDDTVTRSEVLSYIQELAAKEVIIRQTAIADSLNEANVIQGRFTET